MTFTLQIKGHAARISKHPVEKANSGSGECISENIFADKFAAIL